MTDGGWPVGVPAGITVTVSDEQADQVVDVDHLAQLASAVVAGEDADYEDRIQELTVALRADRKPRPFQAEALDAWLAASRAYTITAVGQAEAEPAVAVGAGPQP